MLYQELELGSLTHWTILVVVDVLEVLVALDGEVEFHSVITCRDCLHVKVNEVVFLNCVDVVEVDHREAEDENADASDQQTEDLSGSDLRGWVNTGSLHENTTVFVTVFFDLL